MKQLDQHSPPWTDIWIQDFQNKEYYRIDCDFVILLPPMSDIYQLARIPNQVLMAFTVSKVRD